MKRAVLLDTSVASTNIGDQIIMEAVREQLDRPLKDTLIASVASHDTMGAKGRAMVQAADLVVAGGSNLISSHQWLRSVWRLRPRDAFLGMNVVLMGVGWYQHQSQPDPYTRWLLRRVLHPTALHSVRDSAPASACASASPTPSTPAVRRCGTCRPSVAPPCRARVPTRW
ncbi:MAG TPA: polysaccharide pyruvyl transferase family protein [Polymorphobacter sp.]|nr:polysaccharide pyruvyl transferase family protein [Polymorphobacter sp.]